MSNPPGPPGNDPRRGRPPRPAGPPNRSFPPRRVPPPSESPTRHIPQPGRPEQPSARDMPRPQQPGRPSGRSPQQPAPPPNRPPQPPGALQPPNPPPNPQSRQPGPPPATDDLTTRISTSAPTSQSAPAADGPGGRRWFANRTSLLLILLIAALVVIAMSIGGELYARHVASTKVANAVQCEVQDTAKVSFSPAPPVLWQYLSKDYSDISVQTAGNQVRKAKGMKITFDARDIKLADSGNSQGTVGSIHGTVTWSTDGIKQSIQNAVPLLGAFVSSGVTTNTGDGTIELKGLLNNATVKPQIVNNGLSLQVVSVSAFGKSIPTATAQKYLDDLMAQATRNYPLGLHADSIKVTDSGVEATFSSTNATIPAGGSQDPCLANL